jgi:hypothetical protein
VTFLSDGDDLLNEMIEAGVSCRSAVLEGEFFGWRRGGPRVILGIVGERPSEGGNMATAAIQGVHDDGAITLRERPEGVRHARVMVTFLPEQAETDAGQLSDARRAAIERMLSRMRRGVDFGGERFDRPSLYADRTD